MGIINLDLWNAVVLHVWANEIENNINKLILILINNVSWI